MKLTPGFWNEYSPPASAIAAVVQMPNYRMTPEAVVATYFKDSERARVARRAALDAMEEGK